jgi:hypothetical protein
VKVGWKNDVRGYVEHPSSHRTPAFANLNMNANPDDDDRYKMTEGISSMPQMKLDSFGHQHLD